MPLLAKVYYIPWLSMVHPRLEALVFWLTSTSDHLYNQKRDLS